MKQTNYYMLLIFSMLLFSSCLKEEKDIFGTSSAQRLMKAAEEYNALLVSEENGWVMDYFAESEENKLGGYQILCKFDRGVVTMAKAFTLSRTDVVGEKHSSTYDIISTQGPVLSFNGYNPILHKFADPGDRSNPDGFAGDFEFMITKATKEEIVMKGLKRNLRIVMRPMEPGKDWDEYCEEVVAMQNKLSQITRFSVNNAGDNVGYLTFWTEDNEVHNTEEAVIQVTKYTVTNKGLNFYDPLNVGNLVLQRLNWDESRSTFTDYYGNADIEIDSESIAYQNLLGTYTVTADNLNTPATVTISATDKDSVFRVSEEFLGYAFNVELKNHNKLVINPQTLAVENGKYVKLRVATKNSFLGIYTTSVTYANSYSYNGSWYRGSREKPELRFLRSTYTTLFSVTYAVGIGVVMYSGDSTSNSDIVEHKTLMISNPIFVKQ